MAGITLGQWLRQYGLEPFPVDAEEIAFGVIERKRLIASPELLLTLKQIILEEGIDCDGYSMGQAGRAQSQHRPAPRKASPKANRHLLPKTKHQ